MAKYKQQEEQLMTTKSGQAKKKVALKTGPLARPQEYA